MNEQETKAEGETPSTQHPIPNTLFALLGLLLLTSPALRVGVWSALPVVRLTVDGREIGIGLLALLPVALTGGWAWERWRRQERTWIWGPRHLTLPLLALSLLALLGLRESAAPLVLLTEGLLLWFTYLFMVNERPDVIWMVAAVVAVQGMVASAQFLRQESVGLAAWGEPTLHPYLEGTSVLWARGQPWLRGYGLSGHPNALGALLAVLLLLLLPAAGAAQGPRRLLLLSAMALGGGGLLVSFSRSAWLAFGCGLLVWLWPYRPRTLPRTHLTGRTLGWLAGLLLLLALLFPYRDLVASRWLALDTPLEARSLAERGRDATLALRVSAMHPWGVGIGNYLTAARNLDPAALTVHNIALLVAAEMGLLGLLGWAILMAAGLRPWAAPYPPWVALAVVGLFDIALWPTTGLRGAVVVGLLAGKLAHHLTETKRDPSPVTANSWFRSLASLRRPTSEEASVFLLLLLGVCFIFEPLAPLAVGGVLALSPVEGLLGGVLGLWLLARGRAREAPQVPRVLAWPTLLWLTLLLGAALLAPAEQLHALKFWGRMGAGTLLGWATYDLLRTPDRWHGLVRALAVAGILVGLLGLGEALHLTPVVEWLAPFKRGVTRVGDLERISSTFSFPTITAMVLEMTLPLLLVWAITTPRRWLRALLSLALFASLITLVLTLSRAGVVALAGEFLLLAVVAGWYRGEAQARGAIIGGLSAAGALAALTLFIFVVNPTARLRLVSETEETWYQGRYTSAPLPTLRPGQRTRVPVQLENQGVRAWTSEGEDPFYLSYHLLRPDGTALLYDGARTLLEEPVPPGAQAEVQAVLVAPEEAGEYVVEWDMVQENVTWFSWKGAPTERVPLIVRGQAGGPSLPETPIPAPIIRIPTPTRLDLWRGAAQMVRERPLLGSGPNTFRLRYGPYLGLEIWNPHIHANNMYIEWLVGSGILGLASFLWFSICLARFAWQGLRPRDPSWLWRVALATSLLAWFAHGLLDSFWEFTPTYILFWLTVGLTGRIVNCE